MFRVEKMYTMVMLERPKTSFKSRLANGFGLKMDLFLARLLRNMNKLFRKQVG